MNKETTGTRLKKFRNMRGITQKELAEMLGVKNNTISAWENNTNGIGNEYIWAICKKLAITPSMLLGFEKEESEPLTPQQQKLLKIYNSVSENGQEMIMNTAENVKEFEGNKTVTFIPMFNESEVPTVELDYYDQAAGMGLGEYVKDAIPEKVNVPEMNVPPDTDYIIRVTGDSMEPTFNSGDRLFIQKTKCLNPGDIGVFNYMGEQYVKEFGNGELISHNRKYPPIKIVDNLYIQGKVLGKV